MENRESRIDNGKGTKDGLDGRVAKGREEERGGERRREEERDNGERRKTMGRGGENDSTGDAELCFHSGETDSWP